jgi:hypothetical protein
VANLEGSASSGATLSTDAAADIETLPVVEAAAIQLLATAAKPTASLLCPDAVTVTVAVTMAVAATNISSGVKRAPAYECTVEADLPAPVLMVPEVDETSCLPARSVALSDHGAGVNIIE